MSTVTAATFRFDAAAHEYWDLESGELLSHITGLLERAGITTDAWYDAESAQRGQAVHSLCADVDLGALTDIAGCDSKYRGWLLAHRKAMTVLGPRLTIHAVEEPLVHSRYRFGGRPDRDVTLDGARGVLDIKTGCEDMKAHGVQTALQAILVSEVAGIPAEHLGRWVLYLKKNGKFRLVECVNRRDHDKALEIIHDYAGAR